MTMRPRLPRQSRQWIVNESLPFRMRLTLAHKRHRTTRHRTEELTTPRRFQITPLARNTRIRTHTIAHNHTTTHLTAQASLPDEGNVKIVIGSNPLQVLHRVLGDVSAVVDRHLNELAVRHAQVVLLHRELPSLPASRVPDLQLKASRATEPLGLVEDLDVDEAAVDIAASLVEEIALGRAVGVHVNILLVGVVPGVTLRRVLDVIGLRRHIGPRGTRKVLQEVVDARRGEAILGVLERVFQELAVVRGARRHAHGDVGRCPRGGRDHLARCLRLARPRPRCRCLALAALIGQRLLHEVRVTSFPRASRYVLLAGGRVGDVEALLRLDHVHQR
mmetsp:Transcript_46472/g.145408  ORF Transcript_46472/g.145408 Transcript_46472/m.145408 type:complete len:333 (-) Transcript_46472:1985-2983(-)